VELRPLIIVLLRVLEAALAIPEAASAFYSRD